MCIILQASTDDNCYAISTHQRLVSTTTSKSRPLLNPPREFVELCRKHQNPSQLAPCRENIQSLGLHNHFDVADGEMFLAVGQ
jgi:hypothetical protein